jgi:hypothetical protein
MKALVKAMGEFGPAAQHIALGLGTGPGPAFKVSPPTSFMSATIPRVTFWASF